jgi:hypothetical protein
MIRRSESVILHDLLPHNDGQHDSHRLLFAPRRTCRACTSTTVRPRSRRIDLVLPSTVLAVSRSIGNQSQNYTSIFTHSFQNTHGNL